ncbi:hypothetical protein BDW62DRAFT_210001 [Aspergillus aurantiobrunneus]
MGQAIPSDDFADEPDTLTKIQSKLNHLDRIYNSGKPLFPRHLLADLDSQIDQGNDEVHIDDLDDVSHTYSLKVPAWCADFATTYRIGYSSIQNLTCIHPSFPENSLRDNSPVSICYTSSADFYPRASLADVQGRFAQSVERWEESETRRALVGSLEKLRSEVALTRPVRKIIGIGLGSLGFLEDEYHCARAHAQHAAVGTMVRVLTRGKAGKGVNGHGYGSGNGNGCLTMTTNGQSDGDRDRGLNGDGKVAGMNVDGGGIRCYAQDPAYNDVDKALLRSIGIEPLDDPKGFLEIDEYTLVFSVSPNVPVKQVVADVQWPGAMIWNTVSFEDKEARWEKKVRDGEEFWVVPFTTDPDSQRVRKMVQHYTSMPLHDSNEYFGDLTIYVR